MTRPSGLRRLCWFCLGWVAVAFAFVGVVLPGLPTVGFLVGATACFSRSSPRFEQWILDLPHLGPMVRDHRAGLGMPRRAKVIAITMMVAACTASAVIIGSLAVGALVVGTGALGVWYVGWRVPTKAPIPALVQLPGR